MNSVPIDKNIEPVTHDRHHEWMQSEGTYPHTFATCPAENMANYRYANLMDIHDPMGCVACRDCGAYFNVYDTDILLKR